MQPQQRLPGIESLRAFAAVSIILFHLGFLGKVELVDSIKFIPSYFGFGVPLFFVVSGFSLAYGYWGKLDTSHELRGYFIRRFARIAPLFYAVLAFQLIHMWWKLDITYPVLDVVLNVGFVFNVVPHLSEGIIPASWTIGIEMIFYVLFPPMLLTCTSPLRTGLVLALTTALANAFGQDMISAPPEFGGFSGHNFIRYLPFFVWGIFSFHIYRAAVTRWQGKDITLGGWAAVAMGLFGLWWLTHSPQFYAFFNSGYMRTVWDTLWGVPFGLLCLGVALHPARILADPVSRYLGKISYSLYLLHPNILIALGEWGVFRWVYEEPMAGHPLRAYVICAVIAVAVIAAMASLTFWAIERPGMNWGKRVATRA